MTDLPPNPDSNPYDAYGARNPPRPMLISRADVNAGSSQNAAGSVAASPVHRPPPSSDPPAAGPPQYAAVIPGETPVAAAVVTPPVVAAASPAPYHQWPPAVGGAFYSAPPPDSGYTVQQTDPLDALLNSTATALPQDPRAAGAPILTSPTGRPRQQCAADPTCHRSATMRAGINLPLCSYHTFRLPAEACNGLKPCRNCKAFKQPIEFPANLTTCHACQARAARPPVAPPMSASVASPLPTPASPPIVAPPPPPPVPAVAVFLDSTFTVTGTYPHQLMFDNMPFRQDTVECQAAGRAWFRCTDVFQVGDSEAGCVIVGLPSTLPWTPHAREQEGFFDYETQRTGQHHNAVFIAYRAGIDENTVAVELERRMHGIQPSKRAAPGQATGRPAKTQRTTNHTMAPSEDSKYDDTDGVDISQLAREFKLLCESLGFPTSVLVNCWQAYGVGALAAAVLKDDLQAAEELVLMGADPRNLSPLGSPLDLAQHDPEMLHLLQQYVPSDSQLTYTTCRPWMVPDEMRGIASDLCGHIHAPAPEHVSSDSDEVDTPTDPLNDDPEAWFDVFNSLRSLPGPTVASAVDPSRQWDQKTLPAAGGTVLEASDRGLQQSALASPRDRGFAAWRLAVDCSDAWCALEAKESDRLASDMVFCGSVMNVLRTIGKGTADSDTKLFKREDAIKLLPSDTKDAALMGMLEPDEIMESANQRFAAAGCPLKLEPTASSSAAGQFSIKRLPGSMSCSLTSEQIRSRLPHALIARVNNFIQSQGGAQAATSRLAATPSGSE